MAYCSLAQLKAYVGATDSDDDALLTDCITRAEAVIDRATKRTFEASADSTRTFDAVYDVAGRTLYLDVPRPLRWNDDHAVARAASAASSPRSQRPFAVA